MAKDNADTHSPTWRDATAIFTGEGLFVDSYQVMQRWEWPLMRALAAAACRTPGRVLEIGYGLGMSAEFITGFGCSEYVAIEAHPEVAKRAREWGTKQAMPVTIVEGFWQDVIGEGLGKFDGILFDTYPVNDGELAMEQYQFVESFMKRVPDLLSPNGYFTYYSDETRNIRPDHVRLMLQHFNRIELTIAEGLAPPSTCDYWADDHMVVPCLSSPRG